MVVFVVLHYMAFEETKACVRSILKNVRGEKKVVVVDNASPNKSYEMLEREFSAEKDVVLVASKRNVGFANGNNLGYAYSIEHFHPDFVVVMNNDMDIQQENFIEEIYKSYDAYKFFVCGPDIYATKKKYHQNPQTRKVLKKNEYKKLYRKLWLKNKLSFLLPLKYILLSFLPVKQAERSNYSTRPYVSDVRENLMLHGSCYIFSPLFINKYPDECFYNKTFMYLEAEILYYRMKKRGEKMLYCPNLKINHHEDVSTDAAFRKQYKKSVFSIKCLTQSIKVFVELMEENGD